MTEIKKFTKIVLIWYIVAGSLFSFLYLVLTEAQLSMWIYNDPVVFWSLGMTMLVLVIATILALLKKEWQQIKLYFEIMLMWIIGMIIIDILINTILPVTETAMLNNILNIVILSINLVLGIYCYIKQRG